MVKNTFPVSESKPLIVIPTDIPQIGFLGGDEGKEMNDSINRDYKGFPVLKVGNYSNGLIKGSNPFYAVAVQSKLPSGVRVASQSDLEKAMKLGALDLRGTYEDTGLVLRTEEDPNLYLAKNLIDQVNQRLGKKAKMPVMIPLYGLELKKDSSTSNGLSFKLKDDAEIIYAPILNKDGASFSSEDIDDKTGLPKKLGSGSRTLYTRNSGLSGLCLCGYLDLGSYGSDLAYSGDDGRVVLVSTAVGGSQTVFQDRLKDLQTQRDAEIEKINGRYNQAQKVLRGEK
jgi:hypothetical protein